MKKILLTVGMCLSLAACGGSKKSENVPAPEANQQSGAGPYTVVFDGATNTYSHSFKMSIRQDEGKVEYFVTMPRVATIQLADTQVKVTGCTAGQVQHQVFWLPDAKKDQGFGLTVGAQFKTQAGVQGSLVHILKGLNGCTDIEMSTLLRELNPTP